MARTDIDLDIMLRHLGAAYYESRHGRATRSDVARALDTVEEHLNEPARLSRHQDPVALAHRMIWDVDVVVDVSNRINEVKRRSPTPSPAGV